jgi:heavy metal translocating P-type ATPase
MDTKPASADLIHRLGLYIAGLAISGIIIHCILRYALELPEQQSNLPLYIVFVLGGVPLVLDLLSKLLRWQVGSDLLAGISIIVSLILGEYVAGCLVILMLSGGEALEAYAMTKASAVLEALAKRMPSIAHKKIDGRIEDIPAQSIQVGEHLVVLPHEICPVDGVVTEGKGTMDEAYLTGEPYQIAKTPGSEVISGAINGASALSIQASKLPKDSRYAKIIHVMDESKQRRPNIRRLADLLGAWYTPFAVVIALLAWYYSGDPVRFLSVLVIATPCPLLIAIPISIIGTISLAARRSIIVKDPAILEQLSVCKTIIFDKTGTLTYGEPSVSDVWAAPGVDKNEMLLSAAGVEQYSRHPLAGAVVKAARALTLAVPEASNVRELPGQGLQAEVDGKLIRITGRNKISPQLQALLPAQATGLECVIIVNELLWGLLRFHDVPRQESRAFIGHLGSTHGLEKVMILSGDRASEVGYLAEQVGISEIYADKTPEQKVEIVREETNKAPTIFVGDGINDAPALLAATVGLAFGPRSDITSEAAGAVILEPSLKRVDELLHISQHFRAIAMQSAVGGMLLSIFGMGFAAAGLLTPIGGAIAQEAIDLLAVLNALRAARPPRRLSDI